MIRTRTALVAALAAAGLVLTACGTSAGTGSDTAEGTTASAGDQAVASAPVEDTPSPTDVPQGTDESAPPPADTSAAVEPVGDESADRPDGDSSDGGPATDAPPVTDAPPPVAEIGGRAFATELAGSSDTATNPLPDLVVDDIRRGSEVNLRNVFPADRPVLIWMWAPH